jgi:hypothetical protein
MNRSIFILLVIFFSNPGVYGQTWFSQNSIDEKIEGYISGIAGDTISGYIKYDFPVVMQKRVTFYKNINGDDPVVYIPDDIRSYSIHNRIWTSLKVRMDTYDGPYVFNRFGILESKPGPIALFRIFEEKDKKKKKMNSSEAEKILDKITINRAGLSIDHLYINKFGEPGEKLSSKEFKKSFIEKMRPYIADYDALMNRLVSKELKLENIDRIVAEYNEWYFQKMKK